MSSLRNAVQRRPHRERAQPLERRRLGLLEKHKDYSLRAKDYNKKQATLKNLRDKAADRNEDEFYFGMLSRKGPGAKIKQGRNWSGTVEGDRGNKALDMDTVRLLKTQDMGYIRTMRQVTQKEVSKLEQQVVLTRGLNKLDEVESEDEEEDDDDFDMPSSSARPNPAKKIVFIDNEQEREEVLADQDDDFEGFADAKDGPKEGEVTEQMKALRRLRKQLEIAKKKLQALKDAEGELDLQRAKMAKTATSGGETRRGKKIMVRTRKR